MSLDLNMEFQLDDSIPSPIEPSNMDQTEMSTDIREVIKQLVFSPIKDEEATPASEEVTASFVGAPIQVDENPAGVEATPADIQQPVESAVSEQVNTEPDDAVSVESAPTTLAAPVVESPSVDITTTTATMDEDEQLFPTFVNVVQQEELSYVSEEMKTQEKLLLDVLQPTVTHESPVVAVETKKASSTHSTPSSSAKKKHVSSSRTQLTSSASKPSRSGTSSMMSQTPRRGAATSTAATPSTDKKKTSGSIKKKLTLASSPMLSTKSRSQIASLHIVSTEEQELARIRAEKEALKKLKLQNAKNLENVLGERVDTLPIRSTKPLTQPQELNLRTTSRSAVVRAPSHKSKDTSAAEDEKKKLVAERIKKALLQQLASGQPTQAQPFSFQTERRSRPTTAAKSDVPAASIRSSSVSASSRSSSRAGSRASSRSNSPNRERSHTPGPTQVKEFHLSTSRRAKDDSTVAAPASVKKERPVTTRPNGLTQVKPFSLMTEVRVPTTTATNAPATEFVSMANQMKNWLGSGKDRTIAPVPATTTAQELTTPKEFHFHTTERVKPEKKILSTEERILLEVEEAAKLKEKEKEKATVAVARPIESFRPPAPVKVTQVQPFHLSSETTVAFAAKPRADPAELERAAVEKEREERKQRLLAAAKLNGHTIAQAPQLAVLQRVPLKEVTNDADKVVAKDDKFSSTEKPHLTEPKPFHLSTESRGAHKQDSFKSQVTAELNALKTAAEFKAAPMPVHDAAPTFVPHVPHRKILADLTPALKSLELHAQSEANFQRQLEEEKKAAEKARQFVAKPVPAAVLSHTTFVPQPSAKTLTQPIEIKFASDARGEKRQEFEHELAQRQHQAEQLRQQQEQERAKLELEQLKKYRETLVHHAKPIPNMIGGTIKPSSSFKAPR